MGVDLVILEDFIIRSRSRGSTRVNLHLRGREGNRGYEDELDLYIYSPFPGNDFIFYANMEGEVGGGRGGRGGARDGRYEKKKLCFNGVRNPRASRS